MYMKITYLCANKILDMKSRALFTGRTNVPPNRRDEVQELRDPNATNWGFAVTPSVATTTTTKTIIVNPKPTRAKKSCCGG